MRSAAFSRPFLTLQPAAAIHTGEGRKAEVASRGHCGRRAAHAEPRQRAECRVPGVPTEGAAAACTHLPHVIHRENRRRWCVLVFIPVQCEIQDFTGEFILQLSTFYHSHWIQPLVYTSFMYRG